MATEIEIKLQAPSVEVLQNALASPELAQFIRDDPITIHMSTVYYDTPSGFLRDRHWTLRLRAEGEARIAAMKTVSEVTPDGMFTRGEWQCRCEKIEQAVPQLVEQGAPKALLNALDEGLIPICTAEFERQSTYLYMEDGVCIEMVGDVGFLYAGGRQEEICELELELLFGSATALPPLCAHLEEDYGLVSETRSKYGRALALMEQAAAEEVT